MDKELAEKLFFIHDTLHYSMSVTCGLNDETEKDYYHQAAEAMNVMGEILNHFGIRRDFGGIVIEKTNET